MCIFPGDSVIKNPPASQELRETWVRSLGGEDPLGEGVVTHSSILAWRIPRTEESQSITESDMTETAEQAHTQRLISRHFRGHTW